MPDSAEEKRVRSAVKRLVARCDLAYDATLPDSLTCSGIASPRQCVYGRGQHVDDEVGASRRRGRAQAGRWRT